jgi:hypothetical protein
MGKSRLVNREVGSGCWLISSHSVPSTVGAFPEALLRRLTLKIAWLVPKAWSNICCHIDCHVRSTNYTCRGYVRSFRILWRQWIPHHLRCRVEIPVQLRCFRIIRVKLTFFKGAEHCGLRIMGCRLSRPAVCCIEHPLRSA